MPRASPAGFWKWVWVVIGAMVLLFVAAIRLFWRESTQVLDAELKQKLHRAQAQMIDGTLPPSPETYAFLHRRSQQLREQYERLQRLVDPPGRASTEGAQDAGLYFREQVHTLQKRLERETAAKGVPITTNFGFPDDLPSSERVPLLLRQLALVDTATTTFVAEGASAIELLRAMDPVPLEDPKTREPFLWQLPLVVRARCRTATLVKSLYRLQQAAPFVTVADVNFKEAQPVEDGLQVELLLVTYAGIDAAPAVEAQPAPSDDNGRAAGQARRSASRRGRVTPVSMP